MAPDPSAPAPRIHRLLEGALRLECAGVWYDLDRWLQREGLPADLVAALGTGALEASALGPRLPHAHPGSWEPAEAPVGALASPLAPAQVGKVLCLGKNFRAHAAEFGEEVPAEPMFFAKLPETLTGHGQPVHVRPWYRGRVDHEAELALVIGREASELEPAEAMACVAALTVANDLTARSLQGADRKQGYPWLRGKNMDGFLPLGPCLVPSGFLDPHDLEVRCSVNGATRQEASTRDLVVRIPEALAWLSRHLTLRPGDLVLMGTPEGVGPLEDGDLVACAIPGIGNLETPILRPA